MPRDLVLGNGKLLLGFDDRYRLRDLYFPHIGQENHSQGTPSLTGIWVDGKFEWLHTDSWKRAIRYDSDSLTGNHTLENPDLGIRIRIRDGVAPDSRTYVRRFEIEDLSGKPREVRLFLHHAFDIGETALGDTAFADPDTGAVISYKRSRFILTGAAAAGKQAPDAYSIGQRLIRGLEGTWRDAEDGYLDGGTVSQGSVDSTIQVNLQVPANGSSVACSWLACGTTLDEVKRLHQRVMDESVDRILTRTSAHWKLWIRLGLARVKRQMGVHPDDPLTRLYARSLMLARSQIDADGAVLAGNDSDINGFSRDGYCYMWPRDGGLVVSALGEAGYRGIPRKFFNFCARAINPAGYLSHKYNPDGSLGSTWHPSLVNGKPQLPIQEDETAIVVWSLWQHIKSGNDRKELSKWYEPLVKRPADFMLQFRDPVHGLPLPSWDLWEERHGIHLYTCASVFAALTAASALADMTGDTSSAKRYLDGAKQIRAAISTHFLDPATGRFARTIAFNNDDSVTRDMTVDASVHCLFSFGLYPANDPRVVATMEKVRERLTVPTPVGGVARYENDPYQTAGSGIPGNPWVISTLWMADWEIARAQSSADLNRAMPYLEWVDRISSASGILPEQVHPWNGKAMSVAPLTWSHAALVHTIFSLWQRQQELSAPGLHNPAPGIPVRGKELG